MAEILFLDNGLGNCTTFAASAATNARRALRTIRPCELCSRRHSACLLASSRVSHDGKKLSSELRREQARLSKLEGGKNYPGCCHRPSHISRRLGSSPTVILDYPPPPQHRPFRYGRSMQVEGMEGWQISGRMNQISQHQKGS